jgi:putative transposase
VATTGSAHLSDEAGRLALERFGLLRPHLEDGISLAKVADQHHLSLRTLERWVRRYRQRGLAGLVRAPYANRGRRRLPDEFQHLIEGLALRRPPMSTAAVHREVRAVAQARGWAAPSYATVYDVVRHLPGALVTLAHEGPKVYADRFDLLYRREASQLNVIWQADHTPLDIWVLDEGGRPARPWLTIILDDHSRAVAGYALSLHAPSSIQTALALRQAIWRKGDPHWSVCGIPETFYTDHGSDFTSQHLEQVGADLHIALVFSIAGKPRGRGKVERVFRSINQVFLCHQPGYTPPGSPAEKAVLTLPELDSRLRTYLVETYNQLAHSQTGVAPQVRWEADGFLPRLPDSLEQLDLLLLTVAKPRRVHQDGIHFQGFRYIDLTLSAYVGEDVVIRYDPRDMAELRVYFGGAFLCRAISPELAGETIALKDIIRARNQRRRELRTTLADREATVEALLQLRRGPVAQPSLPEGEPQPSLPPPIRPRLKRYFNDE